jgi:hypothetical protein
VHFSTKIFFIFLPLDPDPDSQSGSAKSLNPDPIWIHNPGINLSFLVTGTILIVVMCLLGVIGRVTLPVNALKTMVVVLSATVVTGKNLNTGT